jgi:hypothetical protein
MSCLRIVADGCLPWNRTVCKHVRVSNAAESGLCITAASDCLPAGRVDLHFSVVWIWGWRFWSRVCDRRGGKLLLRWIFEMVKDYFFGVSINS